MTVFSICRLLVLTVLLYGQSIIDLNQLQIDHEEKERSRLVSEYGTFSNFMLFTVIAQYQDGTPARGYIYCSGYWVKFQEDEWDAKLKKMVPPKAMLNQPFVTDSRGAAGFNPSKTHYSGTDGDDDYTSTETCHATAGLRSGKLTFTPRDGGVFVITIPGNK